MKLFLTTLILCAIGLGSALPWHNDPYYFSAIQLNWHEAYNFCRVHNMQLATPSTAEKNLELLAFLARYGNGQEIVWIGGSNYGHEDHFVWRTTGQPLTDTYWLPDEPNNKQVEGRGDENCMQFFERLGLYQWNDSWCRTRRFFVCEVTECTNT